MDGRTEDPIGICNQLSFQDMFANADDRLRRFADMLLDWHDELVRRRYRLNPD